MKILVINAGSSSLKYQLVDMDGEKVLAKGLCERIGTAGNITHKISGGKVIAKEVPFPTHVEAFEELIRLLSEGEDRVINDVKEISAIGHRTVQGGEKYKSSVIITEDVLETIDEYASLAPLHNPPEATAIRACQKVFGMDVPQVAVFDTAFHQTMPDYAYMYALPYEYYTKYHIRRYGFHGTSHRYVSGRYAELVGKDLSELKVISCHLGNGASIAAIKYGKSIDTSMGFTPTDGLIMGTRCGNIDPSIVTFLQEKEGLSAKEMDEILNKRSGSLGVSGYSGDQRDLESSSAEGNQHARLALDIQKYQIKKYIGSYIAAMNGVDAIIFTGGIGENDPETRAAVCSDMDFFGINIYEELNSNVHGQEINLSARGSTVEVWVIPTNEEIMIARDTKELVLSSK